MVRNLAVAATAAAAVLSSACATNPATGGHNVVLTTVKGEQEQAKRIHLEIIQFYGLYEDQAVQDYVQSVGARVAAQTPIANWNFKFFVLDDDEVNAFTPGGGYVYIHRGLMNYLGSEAELAGVLGHEIGHDVARHPAACSDTGSVDVGGLRCSSYRDRFRSDRADGEYRRNGAGCRVTVATTRWKRIASASSTLPRPAIARRRMARGVQSAEGPGVIRTATRQGRGA